MKKNCNAEVKMLKKFIHNENILQIKGTITDENKIKYIVTELCEMSLHELFLEKRNQNQIFSLEEIQSYLK